MRKIYVVVAQTVQVDNKSVKQSCGRMAAQAAHAIRKMQTSLRPSSKPITTIILACRDSNELWHVQTLLREAKIKFETFEDNNQVVYGIDYNVETALATEPYDDDEVTNPLCYLPLMGCACQ
jgi:hypothetical protein